MDTVTLAYAKEHLEELVARAAAGEEVRINDPAHGSVELKPAARSTLKRKRNLGQLEGKLIVPARLMEPMTEDELEDWYGDSE